MMVKNETVKELHDLVNERYGIDVQNQTEYHEMMAQLMIVLFNEIESLRALAFPIVRVTPLPLKLGGIELVDRTPESCHQEHNKHLNKPVLQDLSKLNGKFETLLSASGMNRDIIIVNCKGHDMISNEEEHF